MLCREIQRIGKCDLRDGSPRLSAPRAPGPCNYRFGCIRLKCADLRSDSIWRAADPRLRRGWLVSETCLPLCNVCISIEHLARQAKAEMTIGASCPMESMAPVLAIAGMVASVILGMAL